MKSIEDIPHDEHEATPKLKRVLAFGKTTSGEYVVIQVDDNGKIVAG